MGTSEEFPSSTSSSTSSGSFRARERVLQAAEALFYERGYASVTLHDIATSLGIRQASLYYHAPGGKEELFVLVLERSLLRHRDGLKSALAEAGADIESQLRAVARWLIEQPPVHLFRLLECDICVIEAGRAKHLKEMAYRSIFEPVLEVFRAAQQRGHVRPHVPEALAGSFLAVMDGIWYLRNHFGANHTMEQLAEMMIDTLLNGARIRGDD